MKIGFFQILILQRHRANFCFMDELGNVYPRIGQKVKQHTLSAYEPNHE
jgi:hypothetical protein